MDQNCTLTCVKQMGRTPGYLCPQREDSQRSSTRREGARRQDLGRPDGHNPN